MAGANDPTRDETRRARVLDLIGGPGLGLLDRIVHSGDLVVDAGANVGLFSRRLAELVGATGRVHAFEPNPRAAAQLRQLVADLANVVLHEVALSERAGVAELYVPIRGGELFDGLGRISPDDEPHVERVAVGTARLDDFFLTPAFVKCDVEGHELAVLRGAEETLRRAKPTLLVEIERRHAGERMEQTFAYLSDFGYTGNALTPGGGLVPLDDFDVERDQLAHLGGETARGQMPRTYVNDFLFTPA